MQPLVGSCNETFTVCRLD